MTRIKGITIEIDGDTRPLEKALSEVDRKTMDATRNARKFDNALKFNPGNLDLIKGKYHELGQRVEGTQERLRRLQLAQRDVTKSFQEGKISEGAYRDFQREVVETESRLKNFTQQYEQTGRIANEQSARMLQSGARFESFGNKMSHAGQNITMLTAPMIGAGAAAIKIGADFESGMSKVSALSGATADELKQLEAQARDLGKSTQFSASEAAEGMAFLAMAGFDAQETLAAMPGLLDLAAAGQMELGAAADIASNILSGFGMEAEQSGHMADVLALAASSANTDVHQLGEAMKYLAPSANALGWGVEESTAAIMAFSDAGIQGSMAGQAFSSSLQRLANPTNTMQSSIDELNISFFDAQGVMKPLPTIVSDLEKSMKGMTEEQKAMHLQQLFGAEAFKHWAVLLEQGGDKLAENTKMLEESKGAAGEMAKEMNDNVLGKWKEFMSAMQELALVLFDTVQPALKAMIVFATKVASGFGALPGPIKAVLGVLAALVAVLGPIVLIIGKFASAIGAIMTLLAPFGGALSALGAVFAALTGPIGLTIAAIAALGAGIYGIVKLWKKHKGESKKANEEVAKDVDDATKKIADSYEERAAKAEQTMEQAYLQNRELNEKEKNLLVSTQKEMTKATQEEVKKRADSEKKLAEEQLKNIDGLSDERKKAVMKGIEEEYAEVSKTVEAKEKEINDIYAKATEEKRALKMAEKDRILELQNDMRETAIQMMTDSEKEQIALMEASAHQRNELTVKQTQEQVQKAIQKREKVTEEAEKEFEEVVQWAVRQADELGLISEEEKQKIIEQAAEKRDAKINQANETHEQVMARTREHSAEALAQIDEETGERLSKWDIFKRDFVAKIEEITVDTVEAWAWLWKRTKEKWDGMMDDLKSTFGEMSANVKERWEDIKRDTKQKWEDIKKSVNDRVDSMKKNSAEKWSAMWSDAKDKFERIKNSITDPMKKARDVVKGVIEDIKGFFKNLDLKFPEIKLPKLPKFKMDGKFSLNPPSVPKIGVDWFAKGGIMNKPTLFGANGNRLMGGGEAGPEAIIPLRDDVLAKIGKSIVDSIGGVKQEAGAANITVEHMTVRDESDILKISRELKRLMDRDRRARGGY